jgi:hypothetical protein
LGGFDILARAQFADLVLEPVTLSFQCRKLLLVDSDQTLLLSRLRLHFVQLRLELAYLYVRLADLLFQIRIFPLIVFQSGGYLVVLILEILTRSIENRVILL